MTSKPRECYRYTTNIRNRKALSMIVDFEHTSIGEVLGDSMVLLKYDY